MSYTCLSDAVVQTRKPHKCWGCCHLFPAGSILRKTNFVDRDGVAVSYICQDCNDASSDLDSADLECLGDGELGCWNNEKNKWEPHPDWVLDLPAETKKCHQP